MQLASATRPLLHEMGEKVTRDWITLAPHLGVCPFVRLRSIGRERGGIIDSITPCLGGAFSMRT